jgi:hypothetical protein
LPDELARRDSRLRKIREAKAELEAVAAAPSRRPIRNGLLGDWTGVPARHSLGGAEVAMPIEIRLLGPTDEDYRRAYEVTQEAIAFAHQPVRLTTLDDPAELRSHGIAATPALLVNGQIKAAGRIPEAREIVTWIMNAALQEEPH